MLTRSKPLARSARVKARRATPRRSERVVDLDHLHRVHGLPCCARDLSPCAGPIEADHAGKKPAAGRKADDDTCIALCRLHHAARHSYLGPFRSWTAPRMRAWLDERIASTRTALAAGRAAPGLQLPADVPL